MDQNHVPYHLATPHCLRHVYYIIPSNLAPAHAHGLNYATLNITTMKRSRFGFTLVEVLIVTAVLGILLTIVVTITTTIREESEDKQRQANVELVAETLELLYTRTGRYPTIATMTNSSGATVASAINLHEPSTLVAPGAASGTTNSIANTATPQTHQYGYVGTSCDGTGCGHFTLYYRQVQDQAIVSVASRR